MIKNILLDAQEARNVYRKRYAVIGVSFTQIVDWHFCYTKADAEKYAEKRNMRVLTIAQLVKSMHQNEDGDWFIK